MTIEEFYDVEHDPRYLGETAAERDEREMSLHEIVNRLEVQADRFRSVLDVYESPGWAIIRSDLEHAREQVEVTMSRAKEQTEFQEARGQKKAFDRLLDMERRVRQNHRLTQDELALVISGLEE